MNPERTLLICDIDGTIADSITAARMYIWDQWKVVIREEDIHTYMIDQSVYPILKEKSPHPPPEPRFLGYYLGIGCWKNATFYRNLYPLMGLWEAVRNYPGPIVFMTKRDANFADETKAWLLRYGFLDGKDRKLKHTKDKTKEILELAKNPGEYEGIYFIDDCGETCEEVYKALKKEEQSKGITVEYNIAMPKRAWNRSSEGYMAYIALDDAQIADDLEDET